MKRVMAVIFFCIFFSAGFLYAQHTKTPDFNMMKASFIKTFENDFDIVSDTVKADKNGTDFWLVTVKPKKEGFFIIRHLYEHNDNWGYKNNSREYEINVIPSTTEHFIIIPNAPFSIYMGDSIVIPILMDTNIITHSFVTESRYGKEYAGFAAEIIKSHKQDIKEGFLTAKTINNVPELSCLGIKRKKAVHRNPGSSSVSYTAYFKAEKEGQFNLKLGGKNISLTILPKNAAIKTLCGEVSVYQWENGVGSSGGNNYYLNNVVIRVGDILVVPYLSFTEKRGKEKPVEKKLEINKADFLLSDDQYDFWLK